MCDCYCHKCEGCDHEISIHVADFCTERENIKVYCPNCLMKLPAIDSSRTKVFIDKIDDNEQIINRKKHERIKGKPVVILVKDMKAQGIHLN